MTSFFVILEYSRGALAEKLGNGLQNRVDGSVTRTCLHNKFEYRAYFCFRSASTSGKVGSLKWPLSSKWW